MASALTDRYEIEAYDDIPYVWVLDTDFQKLAIIESYTSLIWSRRYHETGDFELYIEATDTNLQLLRLGNYIARSDYTYEVYRIEKVEITTSSEEGNFITASGRDLRCIIYQRCTQFQWTFKSTDAAERQSITQAMKQLIYENFINTTSYQPVTTEEENTETGEITTTTEGGVDYTSYNNPDRQMPSYFQIGTFSDLGIYTESITIDPDNIGDILESYSELYDFGWRVNFSRSDNSSVGVQLRFEIYKGVDRTQNITFAEKFENLIDTKYTYDRSEYFNCSRVVDKENNVNVSIGTAVGMDRFESKQTSEDLSIEFADEISYENLVDTFGWSWNGGKINFDYDEDKTGWGLFGNTYRNLTGYKVYFDGYDFPLYGDAHYEDNLKKSYPEGTEVTVNGITYWRVTDPIYITPHSHKDSWYNGFDCDMIETTEDGEVTFRLGRNGSWGKYPDFEKVSPAKPDSSHQKWVRTLTFDLPSVVKESMMLENAYANMEVYMKDEEFEGNVETMSLYRYRKDYDIGDKVHIVTDVGIVEDVTITEAVETFDVNGYTIEVGFKK